MEDWHRTPNLMESFGVKLDNFYHCYVQDLFPFIYKTVYGFVMCNL